MQQDNYYDPRRRPPERRDYGERRPSDRRDYGERRPSDRRDYGERRSSSRSSYRDDREPPRRPRTNHRSAGRTAGFVLLYVAAVIGVSILLACVGWTAAGDVLALNKAYKEVTFTVSPGEEFDSVVDRMKEEGLIEYKLLFNIFASVTHKKDSVAAGTYSLNTDMDYRALLAGVRANSANRSQVQVTIPEGYNIDQIFALLVEKGVANSTDELKEAAANHDYAFSFLEDIPLGDYRRLEGYLMPDTYTFYTPHDPVLALNKLMVYSDSQMTEDLMSQVESSGYTLHEILTIASLIEREATSTDRTEVSAVIHNRLKNTSATQGLLQVDATLVYINGGKEPTEADKSIDSPYNTYKYPGLPPTPIANPGMEAIVAALHPADSKNYYYALGDDDVHHFFKTYDQLQKFIASQERYK